MMKKVIIIGCPGSGKSTFGRKLRAVTGISLYHLDMLYWNEDATTAGREVFIKRLENIMSKPEWIIDGNYAATMEMRIKECDTVFFLDYSTEVCIAGVNERKGKPRSDMPWVENGNTDEEFITFIKRYNSESRPEVIRLLEKYSSKNIMVFNSRAESDDYVNSLK